MTFYDLKEKSGLTHSLCSQVANEIGRQIVTGRYAPGSLVDDEGALSEGFQVSRTVIRDAVKILVGKGLLEVRRGIGTRVRQRSNWGLLDDDVLAWQLSAPPDLTSLMQLLEVREVFEPQAARWAADRGFSEDIEQIGNAVDSMDAEVDNAEQFVMADARFHRAVLHAAQNEFLSALEGVIYSTLLSSIRLTNPDPSANAQSVPFHRRVYEAILVKDSNEAESSMRLLLADSSHRIRSMKSGPCGQIG